MVTAYTGEKSVEAVEKTEGNTSYGYIGKHSGETVLIASVKMAYRLHAVQQELKRQKENLNDALVQYEQAAAELVARNEELNSYFDTSLDMLCIADSAGRFVRLNPEWEHALDSVV